MFLRSTVQTIMLRKRSRSVGNNKQSISTDTNNNNTINNAFISSSSTNHNNKPSSPSIFTYPRRFLGLSPRTSSTITGPETDHFSMSPTSPLEPLPFSKMINPTFSHASPYMIRQTMNNNPKPTGLGLIDALKEEEEEDYVNTKTSISKLKIQVPPFNQGCSISPSNNHVEFGVKNKSSQLAVSSPIDRSPIGSNRCLSPRDIELLSEDYTCIISHGPNPRTTHIFDNRVVQNPGTEGFVVPLRCDSDDRFSNGGDFSRRDSGDFLSFCHACNKFLGPGSDIFMYRGEKAFCSSECRYQEMLFDEVME